MQPSLVRLGIRQEVQDFFKPFYNSDASGNILFSYGREYESYGPQGHRLPVALDCWIAGCTNFNQVKNVLISSSAMEAIAWLNCHFSMFISTENLLFVAVGTSLSNDQLRWIKSNFPRHPYSLLFGADLLGGVFDLKAAAFLRGHPVGIGFTDNLLTINFRNRLFYMEASTFSLYAFERLSGYRFKINNYKPKQHISWLSYLEHSFKK